MWSDRQLIVMGLLCGAVLATIGVLALRWAASPTELLLMAGILA